MVVLIGESGSGKSTTERILEEEWGFRRAISYTTREKRAKECEGIDYYFISEKEFKELRDSDALAECTEYNGNFYGLAKSEVSDNGVIVVEPKGLEQLKECYGDAIFAIYLKTDEATRRERMLFRGDDENEVDKRIEFDRVRFKGIEDKVDAVIDIGVHTDEHDVVKDVLKVLGWTSNERVFPALSWRFLIKGILTVLLGVLLVFSLCSINNFGLKTLTVNQNYSVSDSTVEDAYSSNTSYAKPMDFKLYDISDDSTVNTKGLKVPPGYYFFECENGLTVFEYNSEHKAYEYSYFVIGSDIQKITDLSTLQAENAGYILGLPKGGMIQVLGSAHIAYSRSDERVRDYVDNASSLNGKENSVLQDKIDDAKAGLDEVEKTSEGSDITEDLNTETELKEEADLVATEQESEVTSNEYSYEIDLSSN